jgi:gas vesicle protein
MSHRHSVTEDPVKVIGIAVMAAAIGAVIAMLVTPRNGEQVRNGIKRRAATMKDKTVKTVDDMDDVKERLQTTASKVAGDVKTTSQKAAKDVKDTKADEAKAAKRATSRARTKDQ